MFKNWKSTLGGIFGGTMQVIATPGPITWGKVALGAAWVILGAVCKDFNVTGGTVNQMAADTTHPNPSGSQQRNAEHPPK